MMARLLWSTSSKVGLRSPWQATKKKQKEWQIHELTTSGTIKAIMTRSTTAPGLFGYLRMSHQIAPVIKSLSLIESSVTKL